MAEHIAVTRVDTRAHCGVVKTCVRQAEYQVAVMWGKRSEIWYGDGDTRYRIRLHFSRRSRR